MDEQDYKVKNYHKLVRAETIKEVCSYYRKNIQDWGGDIIAAFIAAIVLALCLYLREGVNFNWLYILLSVISGAFGVLVFRLFITHCNIHAKFYIEKENEANKYTWNDILVIIQESPQNHPLPVCLKVFNKKNYNIENVYVEVEDIKKGSIHVDISEPLYFAWVNDKDEFLINKLLRKNDKDGEILIVSNWLLEKRGAFLLARSRNDTESGNAFPFELEPDIQYTLQLNWHGEIQNRELDEYVNWYSLKFNNEKISLEEIII